MPRVRGPAPDCPAGNAAWPILNAHFFGDNQRGGHSVVPTPGSLPVKWDEIFGQVAPLTLEIGFNRGYFLRQLAQRWPEQNHVGIEIRRRYGWQVAHDIAAEGPSNVRVIWGDAKLIAPAIFGQGALQAIFINFPDPWWKKRHTKRRLVNTDFAQKMCRLLAIGGQIWVKSDVPKIAEEIDAAFAQTDGLEQRADFSIDELPMTHRETRCVREGLPITRFHYTRTDSIR